MLHKNAVALLKRFGAIITPLPGYHHHIAQLNGHRLQWKESHHWMIKAVRYWPPGGGYKKRRVIDPAGDVANGTKVKQFIAKASERIWLSTRRMLAFGPDIKHADLALSVRVKVNGCAVPVSFFEPEVVAIARDVIATEGMTHAYPPTLILDWLEEHNLLKGED